MSTAQRLTRSKMVLLAMFRASEGGTRRVPYEDLVLQAWRDYPGAFSLRNHPEHPDASDIHKKLYQSLKSNGLVVPLGNKCFRLTEDGVATASALDRDVPLEPAVRDTRLSRDQEAFMRHARSTRAFRAWREGRKEDLVNHDSRLFFGYGVSTPPKQRRQRVKLAKQAIEKARVLHSPDSDALGELAHYLDATFLR